MESVSFNTAAHCFASLMAELHDDVKALGAFAKLCCKIVKDHLQTFAILKW
jgi:hypothetical protein